MSVSQLLGQFGFGLMTDKQVSVSTLAATCSIAAMIASLCVWGMAKNLGLLVLFIILYGFFAYAFRAMRAGMDKSVSDYPSAVSHSFCIRIQCSPGASETFITSCLSGVTTPRTCLKCSGSQNILKGPC
jgi:hypothetical protein